MGLKGYTLWFLTIFKLRQKRHFWALLGALVCLIFLFTFFWAKPVYWTLSGVLIFVHFEKFVKWPQNRHFWALFPWADISHFWPDFGAILQISQNVRKSKRLIAFSILVLLNFWRWIEFRGQKWLLRPITWSYGDVWAEKRHFELIWSFFDPNVAIWPSYGSQKSLLTSKFDSASKIDLENIYVTTSFFAPNFWNFFDKSLAGTQSGGPQNPKTSKWLFQKVLQFDFWAMFLGQNELKNRFWTTDKFQSAQKRLFRGVLVLGKIHR